MLCCGAVLLRQLSIFSVKTFCCLSCQSDRLIFIWNGFRKVLLTANTTVNHNSKCAFQKLISAVFFFIYFPRAEYRIFSRLYRVSYDVEGEFNLLDFCCFRALVLVLTWVHSLSDQAVSLCSCMNLSLSLLWLECAVIRLAKDLHNSTEIANEKSYRKLYFRHSICILNNQFENGMFSLFSISKMIHILCW